jgi:DNA-binding NarL/FixJ family response regulator
VTLAAAAPSLRPAAGAVAVAICAADRALRARLERLVGADAGLALAGAAGDAAALDRLMEKHRLAVAVVHAPSLERLWRWTQRHRETTFVAIIDDASGVEALRTGARALMSAAAGDAEIAITLAAAARGLCVLPPSALESVLPSVVAAEPARSTGTDDGPLTARELEVLAAMADGASNKAIARRLGISFHTAKFHVAGILAKLDADSRTEAVTKAAQLGLVML